MEKLPSFPPTQHSEESVKARRNLIAIGMLWAAIVLLELEPKELVLIGVNLSESPISPSALVSIVLAYFWSSFVVYTYWHWLQWVKESSDAQQNYQLVLGDPTETLKRARAAIGEANKANLPKEATISVILPKYDVMEQELTVGQLEKVAQDQLNDLKRLRPNYLRLKYTIFVRTTWDYLLPTALILGPLWHLVAWLCAEPASAVIISTGLL